jgi:hypothetical protein
MKENAEERAHRRAPFLKLHNRIQLCDVGPRWDHLLNLIWQQIKDLLGGRQDAVTDKATTL